VGISYDDDVDVALQTLEEIGNQLSQNSEMEPLLLETAEVTGVEGLDDWAVRLRIMVKTEPDAHWFVQRYLRHQIRLIFAEKGIELAFPRQDVLLLQPDSDMDKMAA
jgi:small conductance mechanosensitive channel